ncbi:AraC family transcriptional regulator [Arsenicitalea aurantiaca]|uniref:AraC family transcriptional regulator n=1 Tax=Arsenicitalea aurantiaca TaxID=1783274 RepID=A0A433XL55_9HYPH|nr:AraC family transcriptional regulator [Arsenicitalea aurantiaca]RUT34817.1 AraC family transcriptional regulator [Arsenicitalea aurantiaca]
MHSELKRAVARYVENHGGLDAPSPTPVADVLVICSTQPRNPFRKLYKPSLCVVAQGAKRIALEGQTIDYAAGSALAVSLEVPGHGSITEASRAEPFLGLTIGFDVGLLREVLEQMANPPKPSGERLGAFVETLSEPVQNCIIRLLEIFETPEAVPVLYPAVTRELYYRLLSGPNGREICKIAHVDSHTQRIAEAIHMMRADISRPLKVEDMARAARMGVSSFHQHFRTLTSMSPLQYHKQLRLLEARRLMVAEAANVTNAAFRVGYESPSQFSRDYARMFGRAPKRDAMALKGLPVAV